ncbi:asparagine synthase (glutamine-hydrolyzing) [Thalassospira tepidiphila]|uniref:asparagine synthase (glutamine-hydrolyzing) n=1 Tax=Thalassospira tepidiphila TaxID=393657 RepID=UPI0030C680B5
MCGIFGRFSRSANLGNLENLCSATNYLTHRGPDGGGYWSEGHWFFGHRRLSIIDPKLGVQPMATDDLRYVVVFNGEIYNYRELSEQFSKDGFNPKTTSDTEVLLEAWRRWGTGVCDHIDGMFAFAIADREKQSIFLARDRFGEKPLFIQETADGLTFSSEFGAFQCLDNYDPELDLAGLGSFLCLNYVPGDKTLVDGIRKLAPGSWLELTSQGTRSGRFWSPEKNVRSALSFSEAKQKAQRLIDEGTRLALRSDVPVTLFLSGGIDSTLVAESAVRQGNIRKAWCLDMRQEGFSEYPMASKVGEALGIEVEPVAFSSEIMNDFAQLASRQDDPMADSSALAVWALAQQVSKEYKVALGGDGGDELFGGYLTYRATRLQSALTRFMPRPVRNLLASSGDWLPVTPGKVTTSYKAWRFLRAFGLDPAEAHYTWNGTWLPNEAVQLLADRRAAAFAADALSRLKTAHDLKTSPSILDLQKADISEYLPNDILTKTDRCSMAWGLEARSPLLYRPLAEFGLSLPDSQKFRPFGAQKRLLRELVRDRFGSAVSHAKKQGFSIPVHHWLRNEARSITEDVLSPERLGSLWFLDAERVIDVKNRHMSGKAQYGFELWGLMMLVLWFENRFTMKNFVRPSSQLKRILL